MVNKHKILFHLNYIYHLPAVEPIIELFAKDEKYDTAIQLYLDFDYKFGIIRKKKPNHYINDFVVKNVNRMIPGTTFEIFKLRKL